MAAASSPGSRLASFQGNLAQEALAYLGAGLAYATIDYRFLDEGGVRTSLQDCQVCLQYIRYHAAHLDLDPDRMVLAGGSAGAGTSIWLLTSDDLADASTGHAILGTSTRVRGAIANATQATYDVVEWIERVFSPEYTAELTAYQATQDPDAGLRSFFGIDPSVPPPLLDFVQMDPELSAYREAINMLDLMSDDDPPLFVNNPMDDLPPTDQNIVNHHPFHARALVDAGAAVSMEVVANIQALSITAGESRFSFAQRVVE